MKVLITPRGFANYGLDEVEKMRKAGLDVHYNNTGLAYTHEEFKELAKDAQKYGEEAKIAVRNVRRDANDAIKKGKELPEDEQKQTLEESQKLTDKYIKEIDSICETKKKEILNV